VVYSECGHPVIERPLVCPQCLRDLIKRVKVLEDHVQHLVRVLRGEGIVVLDRP
jgi:hypothetical protein